MELPNPYHLFIADSLDGTHGKVPHVYTDQEFDATMDLLEWELPTGLRVFHFNDLDQLLLNKAVVDIPVVGIPIDRLFKTRPIQEMKLKDKAREETYTVIRKFGDYAIVKTEIGTRFYRVDGQRCAFITELHPTPITLKEAAGYVEKYHRHNGPPKFHKYSLCLTTPDEPEPVGVAIASTPKARHQADGVTLEINRVCTDSRYSDACSKLYALTIRAGRAIGYSRFITYSLPDESASSLKAVGFLLDGETSVNQHGWDSPSRPRVSTVYPKGTKLRWVYIPK